MLGVVGMLAVTVKGNLNLTLPGLIALGMGILILVFPKALNYLVAIYLIVIGLIQIFHLKIGG